MYNQRYVASTIILKGTGLSYLKLTANYQKGLTVGQQGNRRLAKLTKNKKS